MNLFTESKFAVSHFSKYLTGILCERESDFFPPMLLTAHSLCKDSKQIVQDCVGFVVL